MKAGVVHYSDIAACPKVSLLPAHYREDGSCRCGERPAIEAEIERLQSEINAKQLLMKGLREDLRTS